MRGDQLSRQWRILRQIEASKYGLTAAEIAELGGVSLKTGYRDLDDLQLAGFPLYADKGESGRRWKLIDTYRFDLPQPFTFTELMSLHMSRDLFKVFKGTAFYESIHGKDLDITGLVPLHQRENLARKPADPKTAGRIAGNDIARGWARRNQTVGHGPGHRGPCFKTRKPERIDESRVTWRIVVLH